MRKNFFEWIALGAGLVPALFACGASAEPKVRIVSVAEVSAALRPKGKPLVVNHWATWCAPCVAELPQLAKLAKKLEGRADFVGVSWDLFVSDVDAEKAASMMRAAMEKAGISYENLLVEGSTEELGEALHLESLVIPQTFVFDAAGKKIAFFEAIETEEDFARLEKALQRP